MRAKPAEAGASRLFLVGLLTGLSLLSPLSVHAAEEAQLEAELQSVPEGRLREALRRVGRGAARTKHVRDVMRGASSTAPAFVAPMRHGEAASRFVAPRVPSAQSELF